MSSTIALSQIKALTPILLVGVGRSGRSAQKLLEAIGFKHEIDFFLWDDQQQISDFSSSEELKLKNFKSLIVSPGYPLSIPWIKGLAGKAKLLNEIELASLFLDKEFIIAVTGSVGKSTCVSQISYALEKAGIDHFLGGNIGTPLCDYALDLVQKSKSKNILVLELSSYQLELLTLKINLGIITAFIPNHLDRYKDVHEYYSVKAKLAKLSKTCLVNDRSSDLVAYFKNNPTQNIQHIHHASYDDISALSYEACIQIGLSQEQAKQVKSFPGLEHRFEVIKLGEKLFINNSKCTTIEGIKFSIEQARTSLMNNEPICVLVGGRNKGHDWHKLAFYSQDSQLSFIAFGESGSLIKKELPNAIVYPNLSNALDNYKHWGDKAKLVLLAPGGASQDEFKDFEDRGSFFKNFVQKHFCA